MFQTIRDEQFYLCILMNEQPRLKYNHMSFKLPPSSDSIQQWLCIFVIDFNFENKHHVLQQL